MPAQRRARRTQRERREETERKVLAAATALIAERAAGVCFYSATYRLFKLDGLDPQCEDYGQAVIYRGTVPTMAQRFRLDKHHDIEAGRVFAVCGNTWRMLNESRFHEHFDFIGSFERHFGLFEGCGSRLPFDRDAMAGAGGACC